MTIIYIIAAGFIGLILGVIIEMIAERPYIESLERKLNLRNIEIINIKPEDSTLADKIKSGDFEPPEDIFSHF